MSGPEFNRDSFVNIPLGNHHDSTVQGGATTPSKIKQGAEVRNTDQKIGDFAKKAWAFLKKGINALKSLIGRLLPGGVKSPQGASVSQRMHNIASEAMPKAAWAQTVPRDSARTSGTFRESSVGHTPHSSTLPAGPRMTYTNATTLEQLLPKTHDESVRDQLKRMSAPTHEPVKETVGGEIPQPIDPSVLEESEQAAPSSGYSNAAFVDESKEGSGYGQIPTGPVPGYGRMPTGKTSEYSSVGLTSPNEYEPTTAPLDGGRPTSQYVSLPEKTPYGFIPDDTPRTRAELNDLIAGEQAKIDELMKAPMIDIQTVAAKSQHITDLQAQLRKLDEGK